MKRATARLRGRRRTSSGVARLEEPPAAEDGDPVGDRERLGLLVRHVDAGDPVRADGLPQLLEEVLADRRVERGERLVEEQELGREDEGAREGRPLRLAAGERRGALGGEVLDVEEAERRVDPLAGAAPVRPRSPRP